MSVLDKICSLIAPHQCVSCTREGTLLCEGCRLVQKLPKPVCFRCQEPAVDWDTCADCFTESGVYRVQAACKYSGGAKELVWRLKFTGARAAADVMAIRLADVYRPSLDTLVIPIPTASRRVRQRGYDQAVLLAKAFARQTNLPYLPCLRRLGQQRQRGASRDDRKQQLNNMYRLKRSHQINNAHILLVDDVMTTGATIEAAAQILIEAGAVRVEAIVFARA